MRRAWVLAVALTVLALNAWSPPTGASGAAGPASAPTLAIHHLAATPAARHASPLASSSALGWSNLYGASGPLTSNYASLLAYDPSANAALLMVSTDTSGIAPFAPAAFFHFVGGAWRSIAVRGGPMFCYGSALATDTNGSRVVYVPGAGCPISNETWTFQSDSWKNWTPFLSIHPVARNSPALADDPADGGVVLFGGAPDSSGSHFWNDTWTFANVSWTNDTNWKAPAPSPRDRGAFSWDSTTGYDLLLGGCNATAFYPCANDTWHYRRGVWAQVATPGPNEVYGRVFGPGTLADDPVDHYVVDTLAMNGSNPSTIKFAWKFSSGVWSPLAAAGGPPEGPRPQLTFVNASHVVLYLPTYDFGRPSSQYSWTYVAGQWTNASLSSPSGRSGATIAYDAADGYLVLFGGLLTQSSPLASNQTWRYANGSWALVAVNRTPPARSDEGLAYDAADGYLLMFGGISSAGSGLRDTWEYTNGGWSPITPTTSPPAWEYGTSLTYDGADGYVLLLSAYPTVTSWAYHAGVWLNLTAHGGRSPDRAPGNPIGYDSTSGSVVLFGTVEAGTSSRTDIASTWSFRGGNWTNITALVGPAPTVREQAGVANDPSGGGLLVFGGTSFYGLNGFLNDTWELVNSSWIHVFTPVAPHARADPGLGYDAASRQDLLFGGFSTGGSPLVPACPGATCDDLWSWTIGGLSTPAVRSFAATPTPTDVGVAVNISAEVVGGTAPYSYLYSGLPSGCTTTNASGFSCTPAAPGNYTLSVQVTDLRGNSTRASTVLNVSARPTVGNFTALPLSVPVGGRALLSTRISGGALPISYRYSTLPPGCSSQTVPTLPCSPTRAGAYVVGVNATDAVGITASGTVRLTVTAVGASGGPQIAGYSITPSAIVLGNSTRITLNASGGSPPLRFAYAGLPPGCVGANNSSIACTPTAAGVFAVAMTVNDSAGTSASVTGNLTVFPVGGGGGASISGFSAAPSAFPLGESTVLYVVASGRGGPLTYAYPSLPPGCSSQNVSSLPCAPTQPGNFSVYVIVSDPAGDRVGAVGRLSVAAPGVGTRPSVSLFFAAPATIRLGGSTTLVVAVTGGVPPYRFQFTDLPAGCSSVSHAAVNCTPTAVGNFTVVVTVSDAGGRSANASTPLTVLPALLPPGTAGPRPESAWSAFVASYGILLAGVVIGAVLIWAVSTEWDRRRRLRADGEAIVRAMNREIHEAESTDRTEP